MARNTARPARRQPPPATLEGALLHLAVAGDGWAEDIPPVPDGFAVTVSFSSDDAAAQHAEALALLGYTDVGVTGCALTAGVAVADFLVPQGLLAAHPTWWRALADQADRAFSLALGPVLAALADVLEAHLAPSSPAVRPARRANARPPASSAS
jgi:hypothetical protein